MRLLFIISLVVFLTGCGFRLARPISCLETQPVSIYIQRPMSAPFSERYSVFLDALRNEFIQHRWVICKTKLGSDHVLDILDQKNQRELLTILKSGDYSQELVHAQIRMRLTPAVKHPFKTIVIHTEQSQIFPVLAHDPLREAALQVSNEKILNQKLAQQAYRQISRIIFKHS